MLLGGPTVISILSPVTTRLLLVPPSPPPSDMVPISISHSRPVQFNPILLTSSPGSQFKREEKDVWAVCAIVEAVLSEGRDVNEFLADGVVPLHLAADIGDWESVHSLLAAGATVDTVLCF